MIYLESMNSETVVSAEILFLLHSHLVAKKFKIADYFENIILFHG